MSLAKLLRGHMSRQHNHQLNGLLLLLLSLTHVAQHTYASQDAHISVCLLPIVGFVECSNSWPSSEQYDGFDVELVRFLAATNGWHELGYHPPPQSPPPASPGLANSPLLNSTSLGNGSTAGSPVNTAATLHKTTYSFICLDTVTDGGGGGGSSSSGGHLYDLASSGNCTMVAGAVAISMAETKQGKGFSYPYMRSSLGVVVKRLGGWSYQVSPWTFLMPFHWSVWLAMSLTLTFVPLLVWSIENLVQSGMLPVGEVSLEEWRHSIYLMVLAMFNLDVMSVMALPSQVVIVCFCLLNLVMISSYTANLAATLSSAAERTSRSLSLGGSPAMRVATDSAYQARLRKNLRVDATAINWQGGQTFLEVQRMLRSGQLDAYVLDHPVLQQWMSRHNQDCGLELADQDVETIDYGFWFHPDMPQAVVQEVNLGIMAAQESDTLGVLQHKYLELQDSCITEGGVQLHFYQVSGLWVILGCALGFGIVMACISVYNIHVRQKPAPMHVDHSYHNGYSHRPDYSHHCEPSHHGSRQQHATQPSSDHTDIISSASSPVHPLSTTANFTDCPRSSQRAVYGDPCVHSSADGKEALRSRSVPFVLAHPIPASASTLPPSHSFSSSHASMTPNESASLKLEPGAGPGSRAPLPCPAALHEVEDLPLLLLGDDGKSRWTVSRSSTLYATGNCSFDSNKATAMEEEGKWMDTRSHTPARGTEPSSQQQADAPLILLASLDWSAAPACAVGGRQQGRNEAQFVMCLDGPASEATVVDPCESNQHQTLSMPLPTKVVKRWGSQQRMSTSLYQSHARRRSVTAVIESQPPPNTQRLATRRPSTHRSISCSVLQPDTDIKSTSRRGIRVVGRGTSRHKSTRRSFSSPCDMQQPSASTNSLQAAPDYWHNNSPQHLSCSTGDYSGPGQSFADLGQEEQYSGRLSKLGSDRLSSVLEKVAATAAPNSAGRTSLTAREVARRVFVRTTPTTPYGLMGHRGMSSTSQMMPASPSGTPQHTTSSSTPYRQPAMLLGASHSHSQANLAGLVPGTSPPHPSPHMAYLGQWQGSPVMSPRQAPGVQLHQPQASALPQMTSGQLPVFYTQRSSMLGAVRRASVTDAGYILSEGPALAFSPARQQLQQRMMQQLNRPSSATNIPQAMRPARSYTNFDEY